MCSCGVCVSPISPIKEPYHNPKETCVFVWCVRERGRECLFVVCVCLCVVCVSEWESGRESERVCVCVVCVIVCVCCVRE